MEMIAITGFLSDSVKKTRHKSAARMQTMVQAIAEANEGSWRVSRCQNPEQHFSS